MIKFLFCVMSFRQYLACQCFHHLLKMKKKYLEIFSTNILLSMTVVFIFGVRKHYFTKQQFVSELRHIKGLSRTIKLYLTESLARLRRLQPLIYSLLFSGTRNSFQSRKLVPNKKRGKWLNEVTYN